MSAEVEESQAAFLSRGGGYALALAQMKKDGTIPRIPVFHEYPKMLRFSQGFRDFQMQTLTCDKEIVRWTENREVFEDVIVHDETEEERILAGGKSSVQIEADRQALLMRCRAGGINADPAWSTVRLRRELGDKMDAPEPVDEMGALKAKLDRLEEMAAMKAKIAALEAQLSKPAEDLEIMRGELVALGIRPDGRWSASRLREELDRATDPKAA